MVVRRSPMQWDCPIPVMVMTFGTARNGDTNSQFFAWCIAVHSIRIRGILTVPASVARSAARAGRRVAHSAIRATSMLRTVSPRKPPESPPGGSRRAPGGKVCDNGMEKRPKPP